MGTNRFRDEELVSRKVGGQVRVFPVVGGRLRLAHEENENLSIGTEMVSWDGAYAIFRCKVVSTKGEYVGYGTANNQRDARLAESLIELAETRSIARALRFAGFGLEYTGAEEMLHVPNGEAEVTESVAKTPLKEASQPQPIKIVPNANTIPKVSPAQCRALYALTKRGNYTEKDIDSLLRPLNVARFDELSREDASRLISYLQTEVGQNIA